MYVRAKKALGQHFLHDGEKARAIVQSLMDAVSPDSPVAYGGKSNVLEVGPGTGALTKYLLEEREITLKAVEIDSESIEFLHTMYPELPVIQADFLKLDPDSIFPGMQFCIIGNFPYNISSQIFFRIIDYRDRIPFAVGMVQKEVAERLASPPGCKAYGILSVLLQAWYDIEYLFTVEPSAFTPPPKVRSAVIRIRRNGRKSLDCDGALFKRVIKTAFNQRRKTIRNSTKQLAGEYTLEDTPLSEMRPEQLSVEQFIELTNKFKHL